MIFEGLVAPIEDEIRSAIRNWSSYWESMDIEKRIEGNLRPINESKQKWEAPPNNLFKINVDAATPNGKRGSVGVVVRDSLGSILAAGVWPIPFEAQAHEAEALASYYGLNLAKECCFTEILYL
ncbi:hypothetical protein PIB30_058707 [Stylosanthes scabra]|uniref:RNase H type-1 domain-containing protein n=1 Tax=Stylosanthes scabra TaxID=79078 RepID=A0ABU6QJW4_9FABA|nr:hypothetical protein [Stylosanthes scabra]